MGATKFGAADYTAEKTHNDDHAKEYYPKLGKHKREDNLLYRVGKYERHVQTIHTRLAIRG